MTINNNNIKQFDVIPKALSILSVVFLALVLIFSLLSYDSFKSLLKANKDRYQSYLLTEQLRLSSDQLTLMARAYAATHNAKFLAFFNQIIAIREGKSPRPINYERVYWDFLMPEKGKIPFKLGGTHPLHQLILNSGIKSEELHQLEMAQAESDELTKLESEAFRLTKTALTRADHRATDILYSEKYFQTKVNIMSYINEFYRLQDKRTSMNINALTARHNIMTLSAMLSFIALVLCILLIHYFRVKASKKLLTLLQAAVDKQTLELKEKNEALNHNIEQIKLTQIQLVESEKMASLGNLVAGVAHEVHTPLGTSVALASHLEHEIKQLQQQVLAGTLKRTQLEDFLASASENSQLLLNNNERAAKLIASFKKIAVDQSSEEVGEFVVADYLTDTIRSLHHKFKHTAISVATKVNNPSAVFRSYPGAFSQIISNLLLNSLMHGFDNGCQLGNINIAIAVESEHLHIYYDDNGAGMSQEQQQKIFEPFFTTKRGQGGSGLGMSIVYNLITHKMKGQIRCESKPNIGTNFTITLPLSID